MPENAEESAVGGAVVGIAGGCMPASPGPATLVSATFIPPAGVALTFTDGLAVRATFTALEINPAGLLLATIRASASGDALEVTCSDGEVIRVDSLAVRATVDPAFAAEFEQKLTAGRGPLSDLLKAVPKHEPPQEWWDETEDENS